MLSRNVPNVQVIFWLSLTPYIAMPTSRSPEKMFWVGIERSMKMLFVSLVTCSRLSERKVTDSQPVEEGKFIGGEVGVLDVSHRSQHSVAPSGSISICSRKSYTP